MILKRNIFLNEFLKIKEVSMVYVINRLSIIKYLYIYIFFLISASRKRSITAERIVLEIRPETVIEFSKYVSGWKY